MMNKLFSEDILIEQPTIALFKSMKWDAACCFNETFVSTLTQPSPNGRGQCEAVGEGADAVCLGRETPAEVVLVSRLRRAMEKLNPDLAADGDYEGHRGVDAGPE